MVQSDRLARPARPDRQSRQAGSQARAGMESRQASVQARQAVQAVQAGWWPEMAVFSKLPGFPQTLREFTYRYFFLFAPTYIFLQIMTPNIPVQGPTTEFSLLRVVGVRRGTPNNNQ